MKTYADEKSMSIVKNSIVIIIDPEIKNNISVSEVSSLCKIR